MTEQQAGPKWVAQASLEHWNWEVREGERCVVFWVSESDAGRIVADHNALQVAVEALEEASKALRVVERAMYYSPKMTGGQILVHARGAANKTDAALQSIKEQGR